MASICLGLNELKWSPPQILHHASEADLVYLHVFIMTVVLQTILPFARCSQIFMLQYLNAYTFNSLAPGRSECDSKNVIFNPVSLIGIFRSSHDNAFRWMPQDLTDDKSTLVQVMAWCRQATSHYLSQCSLSSLSAYCVARPQWVKWALN